MKGVTQAAVNAAQTVAPAGTKDTTAALPAVAEDDGNGRGSRPGPGNRAQALVSSGVPATPVVGGGIGQPSAKDLNERKHDAIKEKLRAAVAEEAAKTERPKSKPLSGSVVETEEPDETPAPDDNPADDKQKPTDKADELAAIAAKDAENRRLKKELKRVAEAPRGVDMVKLRALAKENPLGVAEALGMSLEDLNVRVIRGDKATAVVLDEKPAAPAEDPEKETLRRELAETRAREARRNVAATVETMVTETKAKDGLRWANVAKVGAEAREAAVSLSLAFARGEVDESGNRLATPRRMKPIDYDAAEEILSHFLDREDKRLADIAAKLGAKNGTRPEPRKVVRDAVSGKGIQATDPRERMNRDWRDIGEQVRAKHFGPR